MNHGAVIIGLVMGMAISLQVKSQEIKAIKIANQYWMAENLSVPLKGSWCYQDNPSNCKKYGRLYTWETAREACPSGWRLPTDQDWEKLVDHYGGEDLAARELLPSGRSGFNISYAGMAGVGNFMLMGSFAAFWSATSYDEVKAWYRYVNTQDENLVRTYFTKSYAFSVRCVRE